MRTLRFVVVAACVAVAAILMFHAPAATANHSQSGSDLARVRAATAHYHDVAQAKGYGEFKDTAGIACIANPPLGAMGVHYVNGALVGSGKIDALTPQALVYEPGADGQLHLVAVEYIAFQQPWDATHSMAPMLFGQMFMLTTSPNRFGLPPFYSLHAWIWKDNPSGMFSMWNPTVHCDGA